MQPRPLADLVDPGWARALAPVEDDVHRMGAWLRAEVAAGRRYLPSGDHVLRAFTDPFDAVKVLVVGQDPYPTPGHPIGLSFAVDPHVRPVPRSLAMRRLRQFSLMLVTREVKGSTSPVP